MKRKGIFSIFGICLLLAGCAMPTTVSDALLPTDIIVLPADPSLPAAKFLGWWFGQWDNTMDHYLIVKQVLDKQGDEVLAIYSWGRGFGNPPGYVGVRGVVKNNILTIRWSDRVVVYKMTRDGSLAATYSRGGGNFSSAVLRKVKVE